jgi:hypothetical protein
VLAVKADYGAVDRRLELFLQTVNPNKVNPGDKVEITNNTGEPLTVSPKVPDSTPVVIAELFGPSILIPGGNGTPTTGTYSIPNSSALIGIQFELDPSTASNELPGL